MSIKVFITIDTEEDTWGQYKTGHHSVDNISRLPELQAIFERYGALPTYLVDWPVAADEHASGLLRGMLERGACEIGMHCHPWNTPPFEEELNGRNSMLCNLPPGLVRKKMENLHEKIFGRFGISPVSFRAGRWGLGSVVAGVIHELGYLVDTSVTPFVDWTRVEGPDFSEAPDIAYRFDAEDLLTAKSGGGLLEIPPTIGFFQKNFKLCSSIRRGILKGPLNKLRLLGIMDRLQILNLRWLSPESSSGAEMIRLSKSSVRAGHTFLNMPFHSTAMLPGASPFVGDRQRLDRFLNDIETFLRYAANGGFMFLPLSRAPEVVQ